jgi:hypothetical protein
MAAVLQPNRILSKRGQLLVGLGFEIVSVDRVLRRNVD